MRTREDLLREIQTVVEMLQLGPESMGEQARSALLKQMGEYGMQMIPEPEEKPIPMREVQGELNKILKEIVSRGVSFTVRPGHNSDSWIVRLFAPNTTHIAFEIGYDLFRATPREALFRTVLKVTLAAAGVFLKEEYQNPIPSAVPLPEKITGHYFIYEKPLFEPISVTKDEWRKFMALGDHVIDKTVVGDVVVTTFWAGDRTGGRDVFQTRVVSVDDTQNVGWVSSWEEAKQMHFRAVDYERAIPRLEESENETKSIITSSKITGVRLPYDPIDTRRWSDIKFDEPLPF